MERAGRLSLPATTPPATTLPPSPVSVSTTPLRACVIGAGAIAEVHLAAIERGPVVLDAVVDRSAALARYAAERFGGGHHGTDLATALARRPDVVHVLTPPASHPELVRCALDAGAHVLCEKPLALSAGVTAELLAHARRSGRLLVEDQNYRFEGLIQRLQQDVASGRLGRLIELEVRFAVPGGEGRYADPHLRHPAHDLPGGTVHDILPHLSSIADELLAPAELEVVDVELSASPGWASTDVLDARLIARPAPGASSDGVAAGESGGVADVRVRLVVDPLTAPPRFAVTARGREGTVELDLFRRQYRHWRSWPAAGPASPMVDQVVDGVGTVTDGVRNLASRLRTRSAYEGVQVLVERFHRAAAGDGPPPLDERATTTNARLVDAIVAAGRAS